MFFFLTYFTLYNRLQFHSPHYNWFKCILFNGWVILHCVYVPQLSYPFVCWWTSRLLPCLSYCKQKHSNLWEVGSKQGKQLIQKRIDYRYILTLSLVSLGVFPSEYKLHHSRDSVFIFSVLFLLYSMHTKYIIFIDFPSPH